MKHISSYIICAIALLFGACTHNNGDIGPLFGTWALDGMTVDGTEADLGDDDTLPGTGVYSAPDWLLLKTNTINRLNILSLDNSHLRLRYIDADGSAVVYNFRKTH